MTEWIRGRDLGLTGCHTCGLLARLVPGGVNRCPRCGGRLHLRHPHSIASTWALLVTAAILYIPANLLPVMTVIYFGQGQPDTILSGVMRLLWHGNWPLALIVFVASILIPLLKMIVLVYLLVSVQLGSRHRPRQRTFLYRVTELVGRWSMVDVFVVGLLAALVQLGAIANIEPGMGATAFAGVVILTMLAAMRFDPRLIWDSCHE